MNEEAQRLGTVMMRLQQWYEGECNGDWEHSFGVKIDTLDNPGWIVSIDLEETAWSGLAIPLQRRDQGNGNWIQYEFVDAKFRGAGGVANLAEILEAFFESVTN